MSPRLPHHRRWNWRIMAKHNKRAIYLAVFAAALAVSVLLWHEYMGEHNLRLTRENEVRDLVAAHLKPVQGAPGTTPTDYKENTWGMDD